MTPEDGGILRFRADSLPDQGAESVDGDAPRGDWELATRFRDLKRYGITEPKKQLVLEERAIHAVLERARGLLGPVQRPYRMMILDTHRAESEKGLGVGIELDVEESLAAGEPMFQTRREFDHGLVLLLDTSLSMRGERLAFLAVTVAAVCESVPAPGLCILGFDSEVHPIKKFSANQGTTDVIRRVLSIPAGGFTNIEKGIKSAREHILDSIYTEARVILISDGRYTEGRDPVFEGQKIRWLHAVKIGKDPGGRGVMKDLAASGGGSFAEVREMSDLPGFLLRSIRRWVRS